MERKNDMKIGKNAERKKKLARDIAKARKPYKKGDFKRASLKQRNITQEGQEWLTLALDPFHDFKVPIAGYPDMDGSNTVVSHYDFYQDVSSVGGVAWDAHVIFNPYIFSRALAGMTLNVGATLGTQAALTTPFTLNAVSVLTAAAGADLWPTSLVWAPAGFVETAGIVGTTAIYGQCRIIGGAIEIVNTTPAMYNGGSITAYRVPSHRIETNIKMTDATAGNLVDGTCLGIYDMDYPENAAKAAKLYGTESWKAEEGVYMPLAFNSHETALSHWANEVVTWGIPSSEGGFTVCTKVTGGAATTTPGPAAIKKTNLCACGAFLTGLNANATFRVKLRLYVEKCPSVNEAELAVLASPSAPFDVKALEAYSMILRKLPIACKQGDNANGDWFKNILKTIDGLARPFIGMIPGLNGIYNKAFDLVDGGVTAIGRALPFLP